MACAYEHGLWSEIIRATAVLDKDGIVIAPGDVRYGEIAFEMLDLDEYIEVCGFAEREPLSASEWEFLRAVRHERSRRQAYHSWKANQKKAE